MKKNLIKTISSVISVLLISGNCITQCCPPGDDIIPRGQGPQAAKVRKLLDDFDIDRQTQVIKRIQNVIYEGQDVRLNEYFLKARKFLGNFDINRQTQIIKRIQNVIYEGQNVRLNKSFLIDILNNAGVDIDRCTKRRKGLLLKHIDENWEKVIPVLLEVRAGCILITLIERSLDCKLQSCESLVGFLNRVLGLSVPLYICNNRCALLKFFGEKQHTFQILGVNLQPRAMVQPVPEQYLHIDTSSSQSDSENFFEEYFFD